MGKESIIAQKARLCIENDQNKNPGRQNRTSMQKEKAAVATCAEII